MSSMYEDLKGRVIQLAEDLYAADPEEYTAIRASLGDAGGPTVWNVVDMGNDVRVLAGSALAPAADRRNPAGGPDTAQRDATPFALLLKAVAAELALRQVTYKLDFTAGAVSAAICVVPANAIILGATVVVETAFDGSPTLEVGASGDLDALVANVVPGIADTYAGGVSKRYSSDKTILLTVSSGATVGAGYVTVSFLRAG